MFSPFFDVDDAFFPLSCGFPFSGRSAQPRLTQQAAPSAGGQMTVRPETDAGLWNFDRYLREPMSLSLEEKDDRFEASIVTPSSVKPEELSIEVKDGVLTVRGEHKEESKSEEAATGRQSSRRSYTSFSRSLALPSSVAEEKISAAVDDKSGALKITMEKLQEQTTRRIAIAGAKQASIEASKPQAKADL